MKCLRCGEECWRDSVDVEVGVMYGPWGCPCGWSDNPEYDVSEGPKTTPGGYVIDKWGGATPPVATMPARL